MGKKESQKALKNFIIGLKTLQKRGAGLTSWEFSNEIREARPPDENFDELASWKQYTETGYKNMTISIELFDPKTK